MFGANPVRGVDKSAGGSLWVQAVFGTIQGEGPYSGEPAIFVRLAGCNLRCHFCDTDFESSTWHPTLDQLLQRIAEAREGVQTALVVLTGGEPLRQPIARLLARLIASGLRVQIETAGTVWPPGMDDPEIMGALRDGSLTFVCSPKTGAVNKSVALWCRHWKYIVAADDPGQPGNGLPLASTQERGREAAVYVPEQRGTIWVQPRMDYIAQAQDKVPVIDDVATQANMEHAAWLAMRHGYRLSIQIHKLVGIE